MNFLLVTIGSHGDVHPFVGLAAALKRRGHDATLMTNAHFESLARREGIDFIPFGTSADYLEMTRNPDLWNKMRGFKTIFTSINSTLRKNYELVAEYVSRNPATIVIGSSLALGARLAKDKLGFPMMTVHLSPSIFRSSISPPNIPGLVMPRWLPIRVKQLMWAAGDRLMIDPLVAPPLNALRDELELPRVKNVLRDWWLSPDVVVGMFPEWFAPPQLDWPRQTRLTHFPLWDERGHAPMPRELLNFLNAGDPPIAFTPGSAMFQGDRFFRAAVDACKQLGRRGILLSRHLPHIPGDLPSSIVHVDYAPFSELLPRVAALVHHGGIGTTSQALRAGTPQLIMPMAHDQFDNAMRVRDLGAGDKIAARRFRAEPLAAKLDRLLRHDSLRNRCKQLAARFAGVDGIEQTCDLAEELAEKLAEQLAAK